MRLDRYENYNDSGIDWLGDIPVGWKLDRIKNIGSVNGRVGWKALKASEYVESGYFFLSTPNIKNVEIDFANANYITAERYYESPEIMLKVGDILLVKDGSTLGIVNVVRFLPSEGTVNSSIGVVRTKSVNAVYGYYYLLSNYIQNIIQLKKEGMGVPHLFQKDINNFKILIPPRNEQQKIADYLDKKTAQIDKKVELLEQKIAYYKELRKSIINETVCRGLDKNLALKDSGIEWIGKIPEHWEVKRMKELFFIDKQVVGNRSSEYKLLSLTQNGVIYRDVEKSAGKYPAEFDTYQKVKKGDLIFCLFDLDVTPRTVGYSELDGMITGAYTIIKKKVAKANNEYYYYLYLMIDTSKKLSLLYTGLRNTIKKEIFLSIETVVPPIDEQKEIVKYISQKTKMIDSIIDNIKSQTSTLKELRKTLINDVVTGKLKVN